MSAFAAVIGVLFVLAALVAVFGLVVSLVATVGLSFTVKWVPVIYNVRSLTRRKVTTSLTVLGLALVVFVFATVLMLQRGIRSTLVTGGNVDNVVVLRTGATADISSVVDRNQFKLLSSLDAVAGDKGGAPLAVPQAAVLIYAQRVGGTSTDGANVLVRGLTDKMLELHPNIHVAEGRWFTPGTSEIVIGKAMRGRFVGAELGSQMTFARRSWTVVGVMDAGGSAYGSEIWGDVEQVMEAFQRTLYSIVTMKVKDPGAIKDLAARVLADPQLNLDVKQERQYFEELSAGLSNLLGFLGLFVAVVFSLGATIGATISMYAQVAARTREVGTLRALGFQRSAVLVSFVVESILVGVISGVIGVGASALMQFASFSTVNFNTFSEVTFRFTLTPGVVVASLVFAAAMGYAGGFLPALRAARMPIVQATRGA